MPQARKRFGQHFLHDQNIIESILRALDPQPGENIIEIGPGRGALTYPLLQRCKTLTAIELDRDLVPILKQQASRFGTLEVINADILEFELSSIPRGDGFRLVGNLPYNISTPLMFHLLESAQDIRDMHFMVQKSGVANRCASRRCQLRTPFSDATVSMQLPVPARCCSRLFQAASQSRFRGHSSGTVPRTSA
jgi:16S rRNA (adenine1518-N6/adenine1519-N6)-dimethyltransferase